MADAKKVRPDFAVDYVKGDWDRVTHTGNPQVDNLMEAIVGLVAEVRAIKRRTMLTEKVLNEKEIVPEILRILRPGGVFSHHDLLSHGNPRQKALPDRARQGAAVGNQAPQQLRDPLSQVLGKRLPRLAAQSGFRRRLHDQAGQRQLHRDWHQAGLTERHFCKETAARERLRSLAVSLAPTVRGSRNGSRITSTRPRSF
jgi:hypothetical protein